jgi:hypothetical protein
MDIGNFASHWVKVAWFGNASGAILDYGVMETVNMITNADEAYLRARLLPALHQWRSEQLSENPPDFCFIDSGSGMHTEAVYEFIRQAGGTPFAASKGWQGGRLNMGTESEGKRLFLECYASYQPQDRLWLYNVNTEFWKQWIQERFITPTFDESMQFNDGAMSLFASPTNPKEHLSFAQHIVSEERQELFVEGKGLVRKWVVTNKNNHWLDAIALSAAAAGVVGIRLVNRESLEQKQRKPVVKQVNRSVPVTPYGRPFLATERSRWKR